MTRETPKVPQHGMWHNEDLAAAVRLGAADGQHETIRRASLWTIVNLSVDKPTNCQPMWADDAEGGVRAALLRSAGEGQLVELRVRARQHAITLPLLPCGAALKAVGLLPPTLRPSLCLHPKSAGPRDLGADQPRRRL